MDATTRSKALISARVIFVITAMLTLVFGTSAAFVDGGSDDSVLTSTFGAGMGLFTIVLAVLATSRHPSRLAWAALWYLPVFFIVHLVAFQSYVPDIPLLVLNTAALLACARPILGWSGRDATSPQGTRPSAAL